MEPEQAKAESDGGERKLAASDLTTGRQGVLAALEGELRAAVEPDRNAAAEFDHSELVRVPEPGAQSGDDQSRDEKPAERREHLGREACGRVVAGITGRRGRSGLGGLAFHLGAGS